jgi:Rrf2 family protein
MRLSKTSEYAVRVMAYLAREPQSLHSVNFLSEELGIPYKYLARLMTQLSQKGLLRSTQGKRGGYQLAHPLEEIRISDIIEVVEGLGDYHRCVLGFRECSDTDPCSMHHLWEPHLISIRNMVYDNTLADLKLDGKFRQAEPDADKTS